MHGHWSLTMIKSCQVERATNPRPGWAVISLVSTPGQKEPGPLPDWQSRLASQLWSFTCEWETVISGIFDRRETEVPRNTVLLKFSSKTPRAWEINSWCSCPSGVFYFKWENPTSSGLRCEGKGTALGLKLWQGQHWVEALEWWNWSWTVAGCSDSCLWGSQCISLSPPPISCLQNFCFHVEETGPWGDPRSCRRAQRANFS